MRLGIRWTLGNVSERGFQATALSILGAVNMFGDEAEYVVCVNSIQVSAAMATVGPAAHLVRWVDASDLLPGWVVALSGPDPMEGMGWKLAPAQYFHHCPELSLDNDVILWRLPPSVERWLSDPGSLLIAEDVGSCYGCFEDLCPPVHRNAGIRGLPAGFDADAAMRQLLHGRNLTKQDDEQGLQVAMVSAHRHHTVPLKEVSISGYFRPHQLELGSCGAHFVGVNSHTLPWQWNGRSGEQYVHEYWDGRLPDVLSRLKHEGVGLPITDGSTPS